MPCLGTWFEGRNLIVPIHQQLWYDVKLGCRCGWLWSRESRKESMQKLHMRPCRTWGKDPTYGCSTQQSTICMWKCEFPDFFTVLVPWVFWREVLPKAYMSLKVVCYHDQDCCWRQVQVLHHGNEQLHSLFTQYQLSSVISLISWTLKWCLIHPIPSSGNSGCPKCFLLVCWSLIYCWHWPI